MSLSPPASLVQYVTEHRCVLFVGAGLSAWAGLPRWTGFLEGLIDDVKRNFDGGSTGELEELVKMGRYLEVAEYCKEKLGKARFDEYVGKVLQPSKPEIPRPHRLIVDLPFRAIVTTNYDKLLENAYYSEKRISPKVATHTDLEVLATILFDSAFFILKAHGDIARPDTMILSAREYREAIHSNPAFNAVFTALLMSNAVLFLGYSLSDPDLNLMLDGQLSLFKDKVPPRFALMENVGEIERLLFRRTAGIDVQMFPKGQYEEVVAYLQTLRDLVSPTSSGALASGADQVFEPPEIGAISPEPERVPAHSAPLGAVSGVATGDDSVETRPVEAGGIEVRMGWAPASSGGAPHRRRYSSL